MEEEIKQVNQHAVLLGRNGGKKRWQGIRKEVRSRIMKEVALARWNKKKHVI